MKEEYKTLVSYVHEDGKICTFQILWVSIFLFLKTNET